jgi:hypothetical protein
MDTYRFEYARLVGEVTGMIAGLMYHNIPAETKERLQEFKEQIEDKYHKLKEHELEKSRRNTPQ